MLGSIWYGITNWVRQESAAATALIQAFIALGIAFAWWHWSNAQTGAVIGIVSALLGMFVRSQVTPVVRAKQPKRAAVAAASPAASPPAPPPPAPPPPAPAAPPPAAPPPAAGTGFQGGQPGGTPGFGTGAPGWSPGDPPEGPGTRPL